MTFLLVTFLVDSQVLGTAKKANRQNTGDFLEAIHLQDRIDLLLFYVESES